MHSHSIRIYYEDTDLAGIVYYANYLKFIERARSEFLREIGVDQVALKRDAGIVFAVRRVEIDYVAPAVFDDLLIVATTVTHIGGARVTLQQNVLRGADVLVRSVVTIAALQENGRPARMPQNLRIAMAKAGE
ncbi:tol-pal system-associated acyl-CoA thioesterase [Rhodobacteraceae bacterium SC52]|nr:tol-pal system-associated acyl-CoA thioesterase [Rhodobacteraceae bacterium SC52]